MENDTLIRDAHWEENRRELQILEVVKRTLRHLGTVEDVIFNLTKFARNEPEDEIKVLSAKDLMVEHYKRISNEERLTSEVENRDAITRTMFGLLDRAMDDENWDTVNFATSYLIELWESEYRCEPIDTAWKEKLAALSGNKKDAAKKKHDLCLNDAEQ